MCASVGNREFKMPTTNNGYEIRLNACFRIALTEADKIYISPEHTFHRSNLGYSVKTTFLCCKRIKNIAQKLTTQRRRLESRLLNSLVTITRQLWIGTDVFQVVVLGYLSLSPAVSFSLQNIFCLLSQILLK